MNVKKIVIAVVCLTVLWALMDFVIHGVILMNQYRETARLWRPMEEMNMGISVAMTLVFSVLFVLFYANMVKPKNLNQGLKFGLWYGLLGGFAMFSSITYMPIPFTIAASWFLAVLVESLAGGALVGYLTKES